MIFAKKRQKVALCTILLACTHQLCSSVSRAGQSTCRFVNEDISAKTIPVSKSCTARLFGKKTPIRCQMFWLAVKCRARDDWREAVAEVVGEQKRSGENSSEGGRSRFGDDRRGGAVVGVTAAIKAAIPDIGPPAPACQVSDAQKNFAISPTWGARMCRIPFCLFWLFIGRYLNMSLY